jgi:2,3-diketo-5-methylthio-1-phosphopentane phosphatase
MPSNANQSDYFGGQAELTPPQSTPTSAHEEKAPILPLFNLPPSPEDSDSNDARRQVLIFSGMQLSPPLTDCVDFDGTIMLGDTGHVLFDAHGCGEDRRKELDAAIHSGELTFRDASEQMWGSLNVPFDDGFEVMKDTLEMDPDFQEFHDFCIARKIPFNVISAGLKPVLRRVLDEFVGEHAHHIDIVANDAHISADGSEWKVLWKDDTALGHDKAASIQEARAQASEVDDEQPPLIIFIGDGVSDLPAARECDVLFARRGLRLEEYCIEHNIKYIPFDTFKDIQLEVARIVSDDRKSKKETGIPKFYNPRSVSFRILYLTCVGQMCGEDFQVRNRYLLLVRLRMSLFSMTSRIFEGIVVAKVGAWHSQAASS